MSFIEVNNICKEYKIVDSGKGVSGAIKSLINRSYQIREAIRNVSFTINKGEVVGYIGPNGAGKSTTIKILSGVLLPTSGTVSVNGIVPYVHRKDNAKHIGVVFGQRSQLYWDLPISDTLDLYENLYSIPKEQFERNCRYYIDLLNMSSFLNQPVRQLSLGQKMKANIAVALLHNPDVLYLDEPTIGLDVTSKRTLREAIKDINKKMGTTIILTTHDMDDIEAICHRLILIDHGEKLYDGSLTDFRNKYKKGISFKLEFDEKLPNWLDNGRYELIEQKGTEWRITTKAEISSKDAMIELIRLYDPSNLYVQEEQIEDIVQNAYSAVQS